MTYNNFVSRMSVPSPSPAHRAKEIVRPLSKKSRKSVRRRVTSTAVATALAMVVFCDLSQAQTTIEPRIIPAPGTVVFAEGPDRPPFIEWPVDESTIVFDHPLMEHFQGVVAGMQAATPPPPRRASLLTMVLLSVGLGVAVFRVRLLFQGDLSC